MGFKYCFILFFTSILSVVGQNTYQLGIHFSSNDPSVFEDSTTSIVIGQDSTFKRLILLNDHLDLKLQQGNLEIVVYSLRLKSEKIKINLIADTSINILLIEEALSEVVISNDRNNNSYQLTKSDIIKLPALFGESDIIKTIQLAPGVISIGEGTSALFVRGGSSDQNLILLEEIPIYEPSHLLGLVSVFNTNIIERANFYKTDQPATYGGRLSSILQINHQKGNNDSQEAQAGISLLAFNASLNGFLKKNHLWYSTSVRRSLIEPYLYLFNLNGNGSRFMDVNARMDYQMNQKIRVFGIGYFGQDHLQLKDKFGLTWGNSGAQISLNYKISKDVENTTSLYLSKYKFNLINIPEEQAFQWDLAQLEKGIKSRFDIHKLRYSLSTGIDFNHYTLSRGTFTPLNNKTIFKFTSIPNIFAFAASSYLSAEYRLAQFKIQSGVRLGMFSSLGPQNQYDESFVIPEPRFSLTSQIRNLSLSASYSHTVQYIQQIVTGIVPLPISYWVASNKSLKPAKSHNFSIGASLKGAKKSKIKIEFYYRHLKNVTDFKDNAFIFFNPNINTELLQGKGIAYGVECSIQKTINKYTFGLDYTYSKSQRKIFEINQDQWYNAPYDRPHNLHLLISKKINLKWEIFLTWQCSSGRPITLPKGIFEYQGYVTNIYVSRNDYRLPIFHRLDLGVKYNPLPLKHIKSEWQFNIYNAYNRKNAFVVYPNVALNNPSDISLGIDNKLEMLYLFGIFPSISYNILLK